MNRLGLQQSPEMKTIVENADGKLKERVSGPGKGKGKESNGTVR